MIAALVFDFDGVLVDSEPLHLRAYQEVLEPRGLPLLREEYYAEYLGYDDPGVFTALAAARGRPLDDRELGVLIREKTRVYEALLAAGGHLYPGAAECIRRLSSVYPLGIASGAARHEIQTTLVAQGLDRFFRFIVASGDTPASKPAPDPYRRAAELHGFPADACLAVEDSRWGIQSAKGAGLCCIGITTTYAVAELMDADAIISSLTELTPALIERLG